MLRIAPITRILTLIVALLCLGTATGYAKSGGRTHLVESGDTLSDLAHMYGCSLEALRRANKLKNKNVIRHGQTLKIPACGGDDRTESYQVYVVQPGDIPQEIAERFGISWTDVRQANPRAPKDARKLRVGAKLKIPPPTHQVHGQNVEYRVQPGDTLDEIAEHYGTTVEDIRKKNPRDAKDPDNLKVGSTLVVHATRNKRPPRVISYTIQTGDNPSKIAKRYKTTWKEIRRLNPRIKDDPRKLRIGQKLKLYHRGPFSSSRGKPHAGRLINGVQLTKGKGYYIRRPYNAWGTEETVDNLVASIAVVRRKHHKVHDVAIGDLSKKRGGHLRPHRSHQSGRDVDIGFWFTDQPKRGPKGFISAYKHPLDLAANWTFVESMVGRSRSESLVEYIFLDYRLQRRLYKHAQKAGWSAKALERIFQYRPKGSGGKRSLRGIIRHEPGHRDHFHIRFKCPEGDENCA